MRTRLSVLVVAGLMLLHSGNASARGKRGVDPQIAGLQVALSAQRYYAGAIDAIPGTATVSAVRSFQRRHGLQLTGSAGQTTQTALGKLGRPLFGARTIKPGMAGWDVSVLQFLLTLNGFGVGTLDGHFGPRTRAAVVAFQRQSQLAPDSVVGPEVNAIDPDAILFVGRRLRLPRVRVEAAWQQEDVPPASVRTIVERTAVKSGIAPSLALAVAWVESGYQANVRSSTGDWGPMQVSPPAWDFVESVILKRSVAHTIRGNIRVGLLYLRHLLSDFGGDERLAIAAYHQGAAGVRERGLLPETQSYVAAVQAVARR